ncbi:hypothetical protein TNIN_492361 [Trichonephila inaurata madagascariensis]|uniref:Uncharacterized protein n=1 Tax=Trichonephila inaurata madagascariensis TaxID=2747483 RepID=A0A8X7BTU1_9ARAC|nr:hypothetical protein TNIN_492361 [Trichonephila inaurata madagascariensis]
MWGYTARSNKEEAFFSWNLGDRLISLVTTEEIVPEDRYLVSVGLRDKQREIVDLKSEECDCTRTNCRSGGWSSLFTDRLDLSNHALRDVSTTPHFTLWGWLAY